MHRLIPCPSCHAHVMVGDRTCPSCGTAIRTTAAPRITTVLLGLALAGCPGDDGDDTAGDSTTASSNGTGTTMAATDDGTTTADSITGSGGVDYGTADFGDELSGTDTDGTGTGTGTDGTTSIGEPEYGVPETTGTGSSG